jgi:hypothetical protein
LVIDSQAAYKWVVPVNPVTAEVAGNELEAITKKHGALKPSYVVEDSKDADAPLHRCFEWNDEDAADKYRHRQAQDLIRNLVTVKIGNREVPHPVRAFISLRQDHEYVSVADAFNTPILRTSILEAAMKELESFRNKYAAVEALSLLMSNIDQQIQEHNQQAE